MRVLYLATDLFFKGGIQRYGRYQVRALRENPGIDDVTVFSLWGKDQEDIFENDFSVDYTGKGPGLLSKARFTWRAFLWSGIHRPDIVIANHVALAPVAWVIKKVWRAPYLLNVYGLEIWSGINYMEKAALFGARRIIGDCRFILDYVREHFVVPASRLALLYDCVDLERFKPASPGPELKRRYKIPESRPVAMSIGRLAYDKGQLTIIRMMKELPKELVFVVAGGGPARDNWERIAAAEGVQNRVIFAGRVPEEELVQMYNLCDFFIYLSEFKKDEGGGLPLVCIEAAACGKPILASDQDGAREAVLNGKTGFIVPPRDREKIIARITDFLADETRRREMGAAAMRYARENFSYDTFKEKFSKLVADAIS